MIQPDSQPVNLNEHEIRSLLRDAVSREGSQKAFAAKAGLSQMYLSDMLAMRRAIPDGVARLLGYRKTWVYEPLCAPERYE